MYRKLILGVAVLALVTAQSNAAVLQLQGVASVDNGGGFIPATNNMQLNPGDRVRVNSGCALVVYDSGYSSKVCGGSMAMVVAETPPPVATGGPRETGVAYVPPQVIGEEWLAGAVIATGIGVGAAIAASGQQEQVSP